MGQEIALEVHEGAHPDQPDRDQPQMPGSLGFGLECLDFAHEGEPIVQTRQLVNEHLVPMRVGVELRIRRLFELHGRAGKNDFALIENVHGVGDVKDVGDVVGDDHGREIELFVVAVDHGENGLLANGVKPRGRFVKEDDFRFRDQRTSQGNAFLHPARDLFRIHLRHLGQFELRDACADFFFDFRFLERELFPQGQRDVLEDRHGVKERVVLEHVAAAFLDIGKFTPVHGRIGEPVKDDFPAVRRDQPDDVLDQNALAAAAFSDDGGDLVFPDIKGGILQDDPAAECFRNVSQLNEWSRGHGVTSGRML